jgi:hypothetical protein
MNGLTQSFDAKNLAVLLPVFGTAICVTFDVGYFWGIDINFFTAFSLSEHIVFAIQAVPIAVVAMTLVALAVLAFEIGYKKIRESAFKPKVETRRTLRARVLAWPRGRIMRLVDQ